MIIFIFPYHRIGGAEKVHSEIIKAISSHRKFLIIFEYTDGSPISQEFAKYPHVSLANSKIGKFFCLILIMLLSRVLPLTIFGSNSPFFYRLIRMVSENTVKIDLTHAFSSPEPGVENFSKSYIPLISKRIVINNKTLEDYRNLYVREKISLNYMERFKMIPNGVYIKDFDNRMIKNRFNNFIFGYIGRFAQEKRPELFLELTKMSYNFKCRAKMITNRFDLSISDYANLVLVLDVTDPSRIRKELSAISVLLITSEREGFPLVIMEAMELGIPVISTNVGSIKEHVINGFNGFLYRDQGYDEESFLSFCHQKIELMGNNQELYTELCLNAREYAEKNFNIVNMHKAYRRLLLNE